LSQHERVRTEPMAAARGEIISSDGTVLAMTVEADQVIADPGEMRKYAISLTRVARALAGPLRMTQAAILRKLRHPSSPDYVVLQSVDVSTANAISALGLSGIRLQARYSRVYPEGDLAAGLLGFADTNQATGAISGKEGLELSYDSLLAGQVGAQAFEIGSDS